MVITKVPPVSNRSFLFSPGAMTELLLPALRLSDPASIIEPRQRSPIPESSRLARIRAFQGLASGRGSDALPAPRQAAPILAKHVLDGDVPVTVFSSRPDPDDADLLHPISLFGNSDDGGKGERQQIVQSIDHKVGRACVRAAGAAGHRACDCNSARGARRSPK